MRRARLVLVCGWALVLGSVAAAGIATVRVSVRPAATIAGERIAVVARASPAGRRCTATVTRPGAAPVRLAARRPEDGSVSWPLKLPASAKTGGGSARVTCGRAGEGSARFAVRALPAGDPVAGKTVFLLNCGGCHTLADAGTQGTSVDLDATKPSYDRVVDRVVNGRRLMPSFKALLSPQQIADVSVYVSSVAGR